MAPPMKDRICAIIVTWNTDRELEQGLAALSPQIGEIVIVDNGSDYEHIFILEELSKKFTLTILRNPENLGIAAALNRGVKYALEKGYAWVLTLDDDSEPAQDMVQKMLEAYYSLEKAKKDKTAIIAPNYTILKGLVYSGDSPRFITTAITSGQLVKTSVFSKAGLYKEDLFIDGVDHEFCLRLLKRGFKTLLVPGAVLKQRFGPKPAMYNLLGKKIMVANHRPERYYYIYRNSLYIYKNYLFTSPKYIIKNALSNIYLFWKILLFEQEKLKKFLMILRGCADGIRGKYGSIVKAV